MNYITDSGIPGMGKIPWGSHFCQLYQQREDFIDGLIPYFAAGLKNNERCVWITADPYNAKSAKSDLGKRIAALDSLMEKGRIQLRNFDEWYASASSPESESVLEQWQIQEREALAEGYQGLRIAANIDFIARTQWDSFMAYEGAAHKIFNSRRILALCSYSLNRCQPTDLFEVVRNHLFTLCRRDGQWEMLDTKPPLTGPDSRSS
jgi:hypothetical protein